MGEESLVIEYVFCVIYRVWRLFRFVVEFCLVLFNNFIDLLLEDLVCVGCDVVCSVVGG